MKSDSTPQSEQSRGDELELDKILDGMWHSRSQAEARIALLAWAEKRCALAQTNAVAWCVGVIDDLHISAVAVPELLNTIDSLYKGTKNTLRDRYKAETGIDPAPSYPISTQLSHQTNDERSADKPHEEQQ